MNKENKGLVTKYRFRAKKRNSNFIGYADILKKNGTITRKDIYWQTDPYNFLFMYGKTYRENCYSCAYANIKRIGDITIGDYWGAESLGVPIDASAGVSLLTVNSDRGKQLFDTVSSEISKYTSSIEHDFVSGGHELEMQVSRNNFYTKNSWVRNIVVEVMKGE